jgi:hypothetical protein
VDFLSQDNNILKNELDDKNKVIEELAEYYSVLFIFYFTLNFFSFFIIVNEIKFNFLVL